VRSADCLIDGEYEYRAIAMADWTVGGLFIHKKKYAYPLATPTSTKTSIMTAMRHCKFDQTTGDLYYVDESAMYSTSRAIWEVMGATFNNEESVSLPGTRSLDSQYEFVGSNGTIYMIDDNAVWSNPWPDSWFKLYGKIGSGALHEIIPDVTKLCSISFADAAGLLFLMVTAQAVLSTFTTFTIRLDTHTLGNAINVQSDGLGSPIGAWQEVI
jgi:hypothetical protein